MFFDRPEAGRRGVLLSLRADDSEAYELEEFKELVSSALIPEAAVVSGRLKQPNPRWFIGGGKLKEVASVMHEEGASLLIVNHELTPAQERNLERELDCRVLTRTELILHIFADRARTHEGQLQVELAQLNHARTRLVRGWTHLDRQRGGLRMRGAGEKQIELDSRILRDRIRRVRSRLERVHKQREASRRRRARSGVPTVALVGYTNAGKSTLFNALTEARVEAEDRMFDTLDPTMRRLKIEGSREVVLTDTVGFIRDLPVSLVDAFKATLQEVAQSDLLLHVIDASADDVDERQHYVLEVLREIGAAGVPVVEVMNKIDLVPNGSIHCVDGGLQISVSALSGSGLADLCTAIGSVLGVDSRLMTVGLGPDAGKLRAHLYALGAVLDERVEEDGSFSLSVRLDRRAAAELEAQGAFIHEGPFDLSNAQQATCHGG